MIFTSELHPREQIFTHKDNNGKIYKIAVDRLRNKLIRNKGKLFKLEVTRELAERFVQTSGLEKHRLERIVENFKRQLSDTTGDIKLIRPMITIWFKDNTWVLADGNHTYVAAFMCGLPNFWAYEVTRQQWTPFILSDKKGNNAPEIDFNGFSGIL